MGKWRGAHDLRERRGTAMIDRGGVVMESPLPLCGVQALADLAAPVCGARSFPGSGEGWGDGQWQRHWAQAEVGAKGNGKGERQKGIGWANNYLRLMKISPPMCLTCLHGCATMKLMEREGTKRL